MFLGFTFHASDFLLPDLEDRYNSTFIVALIGSVVLLFLVKSFSRN